MRYISTRGEAPILEFDDVLLAGLARDGGLYLPESWPQFSPEQIRSMQGLPYTDVALQVMLPFVGECVTKSQLSDIIKEAYSGFDHGDVAPMKKVGENEWLLELFHGPTLAFKDMALQFLGRMFDHVLKQRGERITIVGATSGDTGSAAIEACRDRDTIDIFITFPDGRVSEVQRRQMTTVTSHNVHNIAVRGTFDDCQDMLKALFNDTAFRGQYKLSAVNSINWARIMAQIAYYFWAAVNAGAPDTRVAFSVPTGNFGNVFAGYAAQQMGLPIEQLVVGSNSNDILTRFFNSGTMEMNGVGPTISPSMDIQISSNFERLLFDLCDRDGKQVAKTMEGFRKSGKFDVSADQLARARVLFDAARFDDDQTREGIQAFHKETGELLDPHSILGILAQREVRKNPSIPMISLATAHPAKFPDAVEQAVSIRPQLPNRLADLLERDEEYTVLDNDLAQVKSYIEDTLRVKGNPS